MAENAARWNTKKSVGSLARGGTPAPAPFAGDPAHSLSQTEGWPLVLPPACLPVNDCCPWHGAPTPADLLRSLADRSQPSGREGHPGRRPSPVTAYYLGSQTARLRRGLL